MLKESYVAPSLELVALESDDVITLSSLIGSNTGNDNEISDSDWN